MDSDKEWAMPSAHATHEPSPYSRSRPNGGYRYRRGAAVTCIPFSLGNGVNGILTVDPSDGPFLITAGDKRWWFEWSERWGPLRVRQNGASAEQPGPRSPFWRVTCLWAKQGKRTEGKAAAYDEPPPITHYWKRVGRSRVIVASEAAEDYDADYSDEIYVEISASGTEAQRAETVQQGSVHDGPVAKPDAKESRP